MLNKAQVIGNLGQDPKVTPLNNGENKVASFSVATTEKGYTLRNGTQVPEKTEWHNIVCFGSLAEVASRYLHKGSKVFIDGKMRTRSYEDKQGIKRYLTEINAETLEMLDPKPQTTAQAPAPQTATEQPYSPPQYNNPASEPKQEDLPF